MEWFVYVERMEESAWSSKNAEPWRTSKALKCEIDGIFLKGNIFVHIVKLLIFWGYLGYQI